MILDSGSNGGIVCVTKNLFTHLPTQQKSDNQLDIIVKIFLRPLI